MSSLTDPIAILGADAVGYTITDIALSDHGSMTPDDLNIFSSLDEDPHLLIIGIGEVMSHPFIDLRKKLQEIRLKGEILPTGAACRTWNLLFQKAAKLQ